MPGKNARPSPRKPRRRINWSRAIFMAIGLLVVLAFVLSMITIG
jgi:predicted nucleic acid-binding Zn ribbon protein